MPTDPAASTSNSRDATQDDPLAEDLIAGRAPGSPVLAGQAAITVAVALGGGLGALARWVLQSLFPTPPGGFPAATFGINTFGCLLMGVLIVLVTERRDSHPALRPFLGVGVLGGFTTFSSYVVDAHQLLASRHLLIAVVSLVGTVVAALLSVLLGLVLTRRLAGLPAWKKVSS